MTKGWCPVHDRVVESRNGTCPECGTPLVDLTARAPDPTESRLVVEEEPEPASGPAELPPATETSIWPEIRLPQRFFGRDSISIGPVAIAAILVAAVAGSFLVGLAIPRRSKGPKVFPTPRRSAEYTVGLLRNGPGLDLRLESFSQAGKHVTLRATLDQLTDIEAGRIQSVDVTPFTGATSEPSVRLPARATISRTNVAGFVAEGEVLVDPSALVTAIRIDAINLSAKDGADFLLDLSAIAPSPSGVPRVEVVGSPEHPVGERFYQVADVVGWPDRFEVRMLERGGRTSWIPDEVFSLVEGGARLAEGSVDEQAPDEGFIHVLFRVRPPESGHTVLRITRRGLTIRGLWRWDLGSAS